MDVLLIVLAVASPFIFWVAWVTRDQGHRRQGISLRRRYLALSPLGAARAAGAFEQALKAVRHKYPDRSRIWQIKRVLSDLRRTT
jgi:hypothetical protein